MKKLLKKVYSKQAFDSIVDHTEELREEKRKLLIEDVTIEASCRKLRDLKNS